MPGFCTDASIKPMRIAAYILLGAALMTMLLLGSCYYGLFIREYR